MANTLKIKRGTAATIPQGQLAEPLFTTDTYDLYIGKGAGGNQRIQNYIASGTSSQFLKGDGTLDSTSYQPLITAGTTLQYYRGDKTFQTLDTSVVPENGPIYFTEPRVRATVLTGLNLSGGGTIAATDSILTAFGKVQNQISALVGGATYQGTWNASTNTPTLASGTGTKGYYYIVSVNGTTDLDGITDWKVGDWAIFNGTTWDKVDNTDAVSSVNGFTGAVNLALDNISDVSAASPTNAQLLRFNGTSSLWENWTPTFEPALTKGNLTEATSSVLTITGGTGAVIGSGTTIAVAQASGSTSGYLSSTDWTTFNNKQAALTNPVTGTGTNNYIPKFTATGSTIGDSSLYYSEGANFNEYTFGSIGAGSKFNNSNYYILSNSNASIYLQFGSNKYAQLYNLFGDVGLSVANTGVHSTFSMIYFNGTGTQYTAIYSPGGEGLRVKSDATLRLTQYTSNGFVKTSGGDGTLSIDTTSYLPLTGGTLTGALSGTSATFSGILAESKTADGIIQTIGGNSTKANIYQFSSGGLAGGVFNIGHNFYYDGTNYGQGNAAKSGWVISSNLNADTFSIGRAAAGSTSAPTTILSFASTGAATFSSSVRSNSHMIVSDGSASVVLQGYINNALRIAASGSGSSGGSRGGLYVGAIDVEGAATFSSTITSNGTNGFTIGQVASVPRIQYGSDNATSFSLLTGANTYAGLYAGAATFSSSVTATGGFEIPNGQFYRARRTSGSLLTDMIGIPSGSDDVRILTTGDFNIINGSLTNILTVKNGGNVGIGTTSPTQLLTLGGASAVQMTLRSSTNTGSSEIYFGDSDAVFRGYIGYQHNGDYMQFSTAATERMRITSAGDMYLTGRSTNGDYGMYFYSNDTDSRIYSSNSGAVSKSLMFYTSGAERMRITSGGNVGIGNTNPADYNANANNLVVGTTSGNTGITISSGNLSTGSLYFADGTTGNSEYRGYIEYQHGLDDLVIGTSAVARMTISGAGFYYLTNISASSTANAANVYVSTTTGLLAYSTSSRKYKHDIRPYDRGINDLMKMNPVYYKGINDGDTQFAGLIAEEIDQLGMKEYVDYLNNEPNALRYSNMVTILVKAIQELKTELDTLKNK